MTSLSRVESNRAASSAIRVTFMIRRDNFASFPINRARHCLHRGCTPVSSPISTERNQGRFAQSPLEMPSSCGTATT
jgi:hypothetical protein